MARWARDQDEEPAFLDPVDLQYFEELVPDRGFHGDRVYAGLVREAVRLDPDDRAGHELLAALPAEARIRTAAALACNVAATGVSEPVRQAEVRDALVRGLGAAPERTVRSIKRRMGSDEPVALGSQGYAPPDRGGPRGGGGRPAAAPVLRADAPDL